MTLRPSTGSTAGSAAVPVPFAACGVAMHSVSRSTEQDCSREGTSQAKRIRPTGWEPSGAAFGPALESVGFVAERVGAPISAPVSPVQVMAADQAEDAERGRGGLF
jgi:hypothetical protein